MFPQSEEHFNYILPSEDTLAVDGITTVVLVSWNAQANNPFI